MIDFLTDAAATVVAFGCVVGIFAGIPAYYAAKAIYKVRKYK